MNKETNESYCRSFAQTHDLPLTEVLRFQRLGREYAKQREAYCNGDPHPKASNPQDKNENRRLWDSDSDKTASRMTSFVRLWRFNHLDFGVGLYPTIQKTKSDSSGSIIFDYGI